MKSPDNDIDRALRAALKRRFNEFEADVDKASDDVIFKLLKRSQWQNRRSGMLWAGGFIVFLLAGSLLYFSNIRDGSKSSVLIKTRVPSIGLNPFKKTAKGPDTLEHKPILLSKEKPLIQMENKKMPLSTKKALIQLPVDNNTAQTLKPETTFKRYLRPRSPLKVSKPAEIKIVPERSLLGISKPNTLEETSRGNTFRESTDGYSDSSAHDHQKPHSLSGNKIAPALNDLEKTDYRPYSNDHLDPALKIISVVNTNENQEIYNRTKGFGFVFNVTPLNTIQVLTVKASPGVIYQNVSVPSGISLPRLGYKVSGGLTKNNFQFLLSYGQLSQSFGYEIASDEFELNTKDSKDLNFVPKGIQYQEYHKLSFVGIGLKRHNLIRNASVFQNYFGDVGLEFSREFRTDTNVLWGNVAIGKQFSINKSTWLTIGPYAEYSFTKMINPDTRFKIKPYQIGLSIGIKYRR
jgi:hypothetical protein